MRAQPLPKNWLIHKVEYMKYLGKDDYSNELYDEPVSIRFVRFDDSTVFSRDTRQDKITANGVIFIDAVNSTPIKQWAEHSKFMFRGRELTVVKVVDCYQLNEDIIHHWELEVI